MAVAHVMYALCMRVEVPGNTSPLVGVQSPRRYRTLLLQVGVWPSQGWAAGRTYTSYRILEVYFY